MSEAGRVLIADDDAAARQLLRIALERAGYEVSEVHDGAELYHVLTTSPSGHFRVVVSDHHMPNMLGLEVLSRTSARSTFVLVTGRAGADIEECGRRLGAVAILRKPFEMREIVRAVEDAAVGE